MFKHIFRLVLFIFIGNAGLKAQPYVNIPDTAFRNDLMAKFPTCFNAAKQLDTTCAPILAAVRYDLTFTNSKNLEGIQYFKNLDTLFCNNNQLTNLFSIPKSLKALYCNWNQLTSLPAIPNGLNYLDCSENQISVLPVLPVSIKYLNVSNNPLGILPVLPPNLETLFCQMNLLNALPSLPNGIKNIDCRYNAISTLPLLPDSLKYLFCDSNQLTILPSLPAHLVQLCCRKNKIAVISGLPSSLTTIDCAFNQINSLPVLPDSLTYLDASNNRISLVPFLPAVLQTLFINGNPLYCLPYLPIGLTNLSFLNTGIRCIPNLPVGCIVTPIDQANVCNPSNNANQCQSYPQIIGFVYNDNNSNGIFDVGDVPRCNIRTQLSNGLYAYSDDNGNFGLTTDTLGSFSIDITSPPFFAPVPFTNVHNFTSYNDIVYDTFALQSILIKDSIGIKISPFQPKARPGLPFTYNIRCQNEGSSILNTTIKMKFDTTILVYDSASVPGVVKNLDTLLLSQGNLLSGQLQKYACYFRLKSGATLGDSLKAVSLAKTSTVNAFDTSILPITGSFDPNSKQSTPKITTAQILAGGYIEYLIHFQNTGTDTAFDIVIRDTLSPRLRTNFLQVIGSSHPCSVTLGGGVVTFRFLNINLPDSGTNPVKSIGFVRFRIKPDSTLTIGDSVSNKCSIYFDYNPPFVTNETNTYIGANTLPISLLNFSARLEDGKRIKTEWATYNEGNTSHYYVQRSFNGKDFFTIGKINAKGGGLNQVRSYTFTDNQVLKAVKRYYFRLEIIDKEGAKTISPVQVVVMSDTNLISIFPNPAKDFIVVEGKDIKRIIIADISGRIITSKELFDNNSLTFRLNGLPKGLYLIRIFTKANETRIEKLIVE